MAETIAYGYSSESTQLELSNEYQHERVEDFQKSLRLYALEKNSLSTGRVKRRCYVYIIIW